MLQKQMGDGAALRNTSCVIIASNLEDSTTPASNIFFSPGESGSFAAMYPAGKVYWILPGSTKKESPDKLQDIDWWKKLQDWGKEALSKTKSAVNISRDSGSTDREPSIYDETENCTTALGKSMMRDAEWIEQWIKQQMQEV